MNFLKKTLKFLNVSIFTFFEFFMILARQLQYGLNK